MRKKCLHCRIKLPDKKELIVRTVLGNFCCMECFDEYIERYNKRCQIIKGERYE